MTLLVTGFSGARSQTRQRLGPGEFISKLNNIRTDRIRSGFINALVQDLGSLSSVVGPSNQVERGLDEVTPTPSSLIRAQEVQHLLKHFHIQ